MEDFAEDIAPGRHTGDKIIKAGMTIAIAHAILKVVGLVAAIVVGQHLADKCYDAVFAYAFEGVILSLFLIGEEAIGPCFLPIFMREFDKKDEKSAWDFANTILTVQALILAGVSMFLMLFPDRVIAWTTEWTSLQDPERYLLARDSLVWLAPALIFLSLGSTTYMLLNGYKKFFLAAFGDTSSRMVLVLSVLVGGMLFGLDHRAVIFGLVLGAVAKLATHLVGLRGKLRLVQARLDLGSPAIKAFVLLLIPLALGIVFAKFRDLFSNVWILSSLNTDGLMKANSLGRKLPDAIVWLVPYALSIAMFPFMCEMVDRNDRKKLGDMITQTGRHLLALFLPFAFLFCIMSGGISELLFRGGKFTAEMRLWAAVSMGTYVFLLPARAIEQVLIQAYFADRRMISVTVMGIASSALSMIVAYVGVRVLGAEGVYALAVVAGGLVFGRLVKSVAFAIYMKTKMPMFPVMATSWFLVRITATSFAVAVAAYYAMAGVDRFHAASGITWAAVRLVVGAVAGLAAFAGSAFVLRINEPREMLEWALAKVRRKRAGG
ncbi:MAG: hypothetical protein C0404_13710 [Verrucomicrobia bacterium]|nr:hypothetical protein [Verrucomicrobiota bacterium]